MGDVIQRPSLATPLAVLAVLAALGISFWLGQDRASEIRIAAEGVRRHEERLAAHDKRLEAHDAAIAGNAASIARHDVAIAAQDKRAAALEAELKTLRTELADLKAELAGRGRAMQKVIERIERLERAISERVSEN